MEEQAPHTSAEYRRLARTCVELAEKSEDSDIRSSWFALALRWERLAESLDAKEAKEGN